MGWQLVSHWGEAFIPNLLSWKAFGLDELYKAAALGGSCWEQLVCAGCSHLALVLPGVVTLVTH